MAGNREVILSDFQACTDIDDVAEAILHLEGTNWDLLAAINNVMPQNTQQLPSEINLDIEMIEEKNHVSKNSSDLVYIQKSKNSDTQDQDEVLPGTSNSKSIESILVESRRLKDQIRILTFHVHYQSKIFQIEISDTNSVENLKLLIFNNAHIAPCKQELHGWVKEPKGDKTILKSLELPRENELHMSPVIEVGDSSSQIMKLSDRLSTIYTLNIRDESNKDTYKLNFPGTYTILDVKRNIYTINDVPVRNQLWKGWPLAVKNDSITLAQSGISIPEHNLSVERIPPKETKKEVVDLDKDSFIDEQEDGEDFEDAPETFQVDDDYIIVDDDIFIDYVQPTKIQHLIPDNIGDEISGTLHFSEEYTKRYGLAHPNFFTGTFESAIAESCFKPPRERKLLAVYLHHDNSILANVFCTQLLGFETVLQLLSANFVIWGWDCTYESNKSKFLASVQQALGATAAVTIKNIEVDTMPVLMIIMKSRSNTDVFTIIHGNVGVNELLSNLIEAVDVFQEQRQNDIEFEDERQARERVKEEQDQAYQESLAADKAKEEAKQLLKKIEKQRKEKAENEKQAEQARKEARRLVVESSLPPEPAQHLTENILKIKVRLPSGNFLERRFQTNTVLQTIFNFLIVKGYPTEEYKLLSSWPRRDLTTMDTNLTLFELKFCPQETLILEER
ncbi:PREDICTED: FAS-associated factor 1 [Ceratosolen solmsi marchali]|uniref:FAS-associated factor 1 n=1 Tax=Ceratosolen solmsi marchali TaxID=326594 RepID=A0AAJ6YSR9_9HYME|nr:PREDICTED: FAS-associated factor 1 [Ceratosolen solmsi marchali]